jgi:hypothetical protein
MKSIVFHLSLLLASTVALSDPVRTEWKTVFEFGTGAGTSNFFWGAGLDSFGNHWLANFTFLPKTGSGDDDIGRLAQWKPLRAAPGSDRYEVMDAFEYAPDTQNVLYAFEAAADGRVFLTGQSTLSKSDSRWIVRVFEPGAAGERKWSTLFDSSRTGYTLQSAGLATVVLGDRAVSIGKAGKPGGTSGWTVFSGASLGDGRDWKVVDEVDRARYPKSQAKCAAVHRTRIVVAGVGVPAGDTVPQILVRSSGDGGLTWEPQPPLLFQGTTASLNVNSCAFDASGRFFLTIVTSKNGGTTFDGTELWMSKDHGKTWKTIDRFYPDDSIAAVGHAAVVDPAGAIWWGINGTWSNGANGYSLRRSTDDGATFREQDPYIPGSGLHAGVSALTIDSRGKLLVGGYENTSADGQRAIVRRLVSVEP